MYNVRIMLTSLSRKRLPSPSIQPPVLPQPLERRATFASTSANNNLTEDQVKDGFLEVTQMTADEIESLESVLTRPDRNRREGICFDGHRDVGRETTSGLTVTLKLWRTDWAIGAGRHDEYVPLEGFEVRDCQGNSANFKVCRKWHAMRFKRWRRRTSCFWRKIRVHARRLFILVCWQSTHNSPSQWNNIHRTRLALTTSTKIKIMSVFTPSVSCPFSLKSAV